MFEFLSLILPCIYFLLPAHLVNIAASLSKKIKPLMKLEIPIDLGRQYKGRPIFGSHKTWRGLFSGIVVGMAVALLQSWLYQFEVFKNISFINYKEINIFLFGFLMSFGALFGDIIFAFFKRRKNVKPGVSWVPFDQINYVIGAFLFLVPYFEMQSLNSIIGLKIWLIVFILTPILHVFGNHLGYWLGFQKNRL